MTALPTTPDFITYHAVYLPKNHFIKAESMTTEKYLSNSHKQAVEKAYQEYDIFNRTQPIESDFDRLVRGLSKAGK